jgi:hypothetical protein
MRWLHRTLSSREPGAALIIVLAFVVLFTGLAVAYLSRTASDRQVAHGSFNQASVDQLVQSAVDNIIGDLRQEVANGSAAYAQADGSTVYTPTAAANMVPQRSGNAAGAPNLIRRSVNPDSLTGSPGLASRASAVNSTTNPSVNGRSITLSRWNTHYLLPKSNTLNDDSYPQSPLLAPFNPYTPVPDGFIPPDWVFVTKQYGADVLSTPNTDANGRAVTVVGRYAYTVYAEGGLLDMNVAGYPSGSTAAQSGRKGSLAYADLTALGNYPIPNGPTVTPAPTPTPAYQVDRLVGWRNYATTQPSNRFSDSNFADNFRPPNTVPATALYNYVLSNTNGFLSPGAATWNNRTNQMFVQRQELLAFRKTTGFSANALQYLSTFSRETNAPSFSPSTPAGSTIDYAALATTATTINPNFLLRRVTTPFTRFDGTTSVVGEPLVKTRFPLSRLAWITYKGPSAVVYAANNNDPVITALTTAGVSLSTIQAGTAANIKACFGLSWPAAVIPGSAWTYTNPTGTAAANSIMRLDQVAAATREPDFFELLQAGILSGSLGQNTAPPPGISGGGVTGGNVFGDVSYMSNTTLHILSIGAAIIDQADPDSIPTRIQFSPGGTVWTAYGVENLPYVTQMYPITGTSPNDSTKWATYLTFQLWNPHQNVPANYPIPIRLRVDGAIGIFTGGNGETWVNGTAPQIIANGNNGGQSVILDSTISFSLPAPLTAASATNAAVAPGPATGGAFAGLSWPPVPTP